MRFWFYFFLNIHCMKYFYLIYFLPSTLVSAKDTSKVPPFLSVICLSPNDSSGVIKAAQLGFEILKHFLFLFFVVVVFCAGKWGGGESVFCWHHRKKKEWKETSSHCLKERLRRYIFITVLNGIVSKLIEFSEAVGILSLQWSNWVSDFNDHWSKC